MPLSSHKTSQVIISTFQMPPFPWSQRTHAVTHLRGQTTSGNKGGALFQDYFGSAKLCARHCLSCFLVRCCPHCSRSCHWHAILSIEQVKACLQFYSCTCRLDYFSVDIKVWNLISRVLTVQNKIPAFREGLSTTSTACGFWSVSIIKMLVCQYLLAGQPIVYCLFSLLVCNWYSLVGTEQKLLLKQIWEKVKSDDVEDNDLNMEDNDVNDDFDSSLRQVHNKTRASPHPKSSRYKIELLRWIVQKTYVQSDIAFCWDV